jgi:protein-S-isoprenylcysteine O-methyltransferase Ste14
MREDLTGEHLVGDAGQAIGAVLFFMVWAGDTFFVRYAVFLNALVPPAVRLPAGILAGAAAFYFARNGLAIVFGEKREIPGVIRKGVFSLVRHPVYLGELLIYLGFLCFSLSLAAGTVFLGNCLFLHFIARHEEKLLLARFGEEYAAYMRDVPMWVPGAGGLFGRQ